MIISTDYLKFKLYTSSRVDKRGSVEQAVTALRVSDVTSYEY